MHSAPLGIIDLVRETRESWVKVAEKNVPRKGTTVHKSHGAGSLAHQGAKGSPGRGTYRVAVGTDEADGRTAAACYTALSVYACA